MLDGRSQPPDRVIKEDIKMTDDKKRRIRARLTDDIIRYIWQRLRSGDFQHDIAADLGINQGRVSEVRTGKRGGHITGLGLA